MDKFEVGHRQIKMALDLNMPQNVEKKTSTNNMQALFKHSINKPTV